MKIMQKLRTLFCDHNDRLTTTEIYEYISVITSKCCKCNKNLPVLDMDRFRSQHFLVNNIRNKYER